MTLLDALPEAGRPPEEEEPYGISEGTEPRAGVPSNPVGSRGVDLPTGTTLRLSLGNLSTSIYRYRPQVCWWSLFGSLDALAAIPCTPMHATKDTTTGRAHRWYNNGLLLAPYPTSSNASTSLISWMIVSLASRVVTSG